MGFFFPEAAGYDPWRATTDLLDLLLKGIVAVLDHHHCSSNTTQNNAAIWLQLASALHGQTFCIEGEVKDGCRRLFEG